MFKYSVLLLLLVAAFGAADEENTSDSSSAELGEVVAGLRTVLDAIRSECAKNTAAVDNLVSATEHVKANVQPDLQKKLTNALSNSSKEGYEDILVPLCEGLGEMKNIYVNLTGYLIPCLEKEDLKTLQVSYNVFDAVINYTCASHRSEVLNFLENGGADCITEKQSELESCGDAAFGSLFNESSEKTNGEKDKSEEEDVDFVITKEHCDMIEKVKTCTNKTLKSCSLKSAALTVDGLIEAVLRQLPCYVAEQDLDNNI